MYQWRHNYMETLVGHVLATEEYVSSYTSEQLAGSCCLALGQLETHSYPFWYWFSALPKTKLVLYKRNSEIVVKNAESMIIEGSKTRSNGQCARYI